MATGSKRVTRKRAKRIDKVALGLLLILYQLGSQLSMSESGWIRRQAPETSFTRLISQQKIQTNNNLQLQALSNGEQQQQQQYICAKYCTCSLVQANEFGQDGKLERRLNLTRAKCESPQFTDLLTIDRRTQIIQISLPPPTPEQQVGSSSQENAKEKGYKFRMPRLLQFNVLREIVIINLKFEVCDSEVFKRGQRLRRLQLNHNRLQRLSKACLRHLDKLIELNLDHNHLDELESALFNSLLSLKSLSLAHNRLQELAAHQFANLTQLISLNLVGNSFKTINLHLFEPMQNSLRLLMLARNQIKSFVHSPHVISTNVDTLRIANQTISMQQNQTNSNNMTYAASIKQTLSPFAGVVFKQLVKLNVDENKFERIKLLQLHRFFNIKFLSIRHNQVSSIRDKAFNGLKLIELNLAYNKLQSISRCAFCNSTIERLVLANNNISLPHTDSVPRPLALSSPPADNQNNESMAPSTLPLIAMGEAPFGASANTITSQASGSQNMLILSQSIFGPLFGQLEYLDLSFNLHLADQLDMLLEPLLKLEFLNLASVGLDPYLPAPTLFKNLRQLRYLNLSQNQLDQLVAETVEPLQQLEVLDLSRNKFSELDESLLVAMDDLPVLKVINLSQNPWYCSQCKVAPLYDWILRSPIYNQTCIAPSLDESDASTSGEADLTGDSPAPYDQEPSPIDNNLEPNNSILLARGPHDYGLLLSGSEDLFMMSTKEPLLDFDLILSQNSPPPLSQDFQVPTSKEDDRSVLITMQFVERLPSTNYKQFSPNDYCLKCEFPGELRSFQIHELSAGDFKFCAGAARITASEPKIGLTLGLVIIGVLFCIIIVVIVMYRNKSKTYYTNELADDTDQLESGGKGSKKPVFSISSDGEQRYGDATDYSSPPMSQSFESTTPEDDVEDEDGVDEEEEDEEELDEDEELDEEEEDLSEADARGVQSRTTKEEEQVGQQDYHKQKHEQKTPSSQSGRSSLSPNDRSASGPVHALQHRKRTEPAKRQASAHVPHHSSNDQHKNHHHEILSSLSPKQPLPHSAGTAAAPTTSKPGTPPKTHQHQQEQRQQVVPLPVVAGSVATASKLAWRRSRSSTQQSGSGSTGKSAAGAISASFAGASGRHQQRLGAASEPSSESQQQPTAAELILQPIKLPVAATAAIAAATVAASQQQAHKSTGHNKSSEEELAAEVELPIAAAARQYRRGGPRGQTVHERRRPEAALGSAGIHERLDRPQSSSNLRPGKIHSTALQSPDRQATGQPHQEDNHQHHQKPPQSPHLGRQKFAFGSASRQETVHDDAALGPPASPQAPGPDKPPELLQMEPRDWFPSPAPSGDSMATTADSLVMETLDELAASDLDDGHHHHHHHHHRRHDTRGPALEAEPSESEDDAPMMQTAIRNVDQQPHSSHSALTQTGPSREEEWQQ